MRDRLEYELERYDGRAPQNESDIYDELCNMDRGSWVDEKGTLVRSNSSDALLGLTRKAGFRRTASLDHLDVLDEEDKFKQISNHQNSSPQNQPAPTKTQQPSPSPGYADMSTKLLPFLSKSPPDQSEIRPIRPLLTTRPNNAPTTAVLPLRRDHSQHATVAPLTRCQAGSIPAGDGGLAGSRVDLVDLGLRGGTRWREVHDIPVDISSLSVDEVSECLQLLNLVHYVETFREKQIDGCLLACLDMDTLLLDFGFKRFDAMKLSKFARDGWRPKLKEKDGSSAC
jgi:hypothetical protein